MSGTKTRRQQIASVYDREIKTVPVEDFGETIDRHPIVPGTTGQRDIDVTNAQLGLDTKFAGAKPRQRIDRDAFRFKD